MPTNTTAFSIGDPVRLTFTVTGSTGNAVNTDVRVVVNTPSGGSVVAAATSTAGGAGITHVATGSWYYDHTSTEAGRYTYGWASTGVVIGTTYGAWAVYPRKAST